MAGTYDGTDFSVGDLAVVRLDGVSVTRLGPDDRAYAESLVVGLWDDRGNYDASVNAYPSSGGSGAGCRWSGQAGQRQRQVEVPDLVIHHGP